MTCQLAELNPIPPQVFNATLSPLSKLPGELLSDIFVAIVFENTKIEAAGPLYIPFSEQDIRTSYHRLYTLLGVCRVWRELVLARTTLWSVIPMVTNPSELADKQHHFHLSLQRAGECKLHLDLKVDRFSSESSDSTLELVLAEYGSRFGSINFTTDNTTSAKTAIGKLVQRGIPETLSELSYQVPNESHLDHIHGPPNDHDYVIPRAGSLTESFTTLVGSLSAFRVCGANFHWDTMKFSTRLVELHLENVTLGYDIEIVLFLQALSSASRLRDLKIISVTTFYDPHNTHYMDDCSFVELPNLRSLSLMGLYYNTLLLSLCMIVSSTHRASILLGDKSLTIHEHRKMINGEFRTLYIPVSPANCNNLYELLESAGVDTLTVFGNQWWNEDLLFNILKAIPSLKTLNLNGFVLNSGVCTKLGRTSNAEDHPPPALETLRMTRCIIEFEAVEDFKKMVASHALGQIVLGVVFRYVNPTGGYIWKPLQKDDDLLNWLIATVPVVRVVDHNGTPPEDHRVRRLW